MSKLTRDEREKLYIKKETELQNIWGNPIINDWDHVIKMTDEDLEKNTKDTIGQIWFEKAYGWPKKLVIFIVSVFILLGIFGLLVFGIRQIF